MLDFSGINPIPTPPPLAGKGVWSIASVANDGDDRDAATAMAAAEAAINRTNWLGWRMVNAITGGTYTPNFTWTGNHTFTGQVHFTNDFHQLKKLHVLQTSDLDGAVTIGGQLTASAGVSIPLGSVVQLGEKVIHAGDAAYVALRKGTGPNADTTFDPWKKDLWIAPAQTGADHTWTMNPPPGNEIVETTVAMPTVGAKDLVLVDANDGFGIISLGSALSRSVTLLYNGSNWRVKASSIV